MTLRDWNEALNHAKTACDNITQEYGIDLKISVSTSQGQRSICIVVFDALGNFFKEFYSGIHTTKNGYIQAIDRQIDRILEII